MQDNPPQATLTPESPWQALLGRLRNRPDSEHEQALIRIAIILCVFTYLLAFRSESAGTVSNWSLTLVFGALLVFCVGLFAAILLQPGQSVIRRVVAMVIDLGMTTYWLSATDELGAPWYPVYLWITFGNGFRYGERYLYLSGALSLAGFSTVIAITPFWSNHLSLSLGLLIALVILPGYAAMLLRRINQERQRAETANRAKSDFLARMSHEIRTPLNGIIATGELLTSCQLNREEREYVDTINASGHTLLHLIEDILDISKIEAGKLTLEHVDFDLHGLIQSTVRMFLHQANARGLRLRSHIDLHTPFLLRGDALHLRQILINLIGNAIKFTAQGSVEVRCETLRYGVGRALLRFEIIDTGIGIPQAVQEHIFEKFAQADESTTRRYGGTGLGTAIARQLVELMGGRIGFRSTPGIGTAFWFDIEFEQQTQPAEELDTRQLQDCRVLRFGTGDSLATEVTRYLDGWRVPYHNVYTPQDLVRTLSDDTGAGPHFDVLILDHAPAAASIPALLKALHSRVTQLDLTVLFVYEQGQTIPAQNAHANAVYSLPAPVNKAILFNALHASHVLSYEDDGIINLAERLTREYATPQKLNILVAEDNETNRIVIGRILERAGHDYRLARDGQEALDALNAETFDLVIVDMHMPVAGGIEVFKLHRFAHAGEGELPFIMLTANATVEARQACREAGIQYFLTKPLSASRLIEVIAKATADTRAGETRERAALNAPRAPRNPGEAIIDRATLTEVASLGSSRDFAQKLAENFVRDGRQLLQDMADAVNGKDAGHFIELAHALKGSAALLGLQELAGHADEANRLLPEQVELQGRDCLDRLEATFARAKSALETEIARVNPAAH